ncbi:caspase family protein [Variovorax terrae]|uniref:Caspase family protein n=1 Tax=Variovorax terrae TaxID=2923278 RepID=A0A9X1VVF2_9BURK|nr:caspase family protein [Variovorax terrae]MCJ0763963.1 caspase family protein [Variovorax terrae]
MAKSPEPSEKRVALVIGNSTYKNSPLKNPTNDAKDMAAKLRSLGFEVIERSNLRTRQMGAALREFRSKLTPGAVALVFYAGHGVQIRGENYLPTVDAEIDSEEDIPSQSLSVKQVMDVLDDAKTRLNLVFLDACRNNPYARSFRSAAGEGLARVSAPSGTLISYATRPGSVAADGEGRNGLYTGYLLKQMEQSNQPVEQVLKRVVSGVKAASQGRQEPWMEGSIEGDFCFGNCAAGGTAASPARIRTAGEIEDDLWESIRGSGSKAAFDEYLRQYPRGKYAAQAASLAKAPVADDSQQMAAWSRADKSRSVADYEAYLSSYPSGRFAALAASRIALTRNAAADDEAWARASQANSRPALMAYVNAYPGGSHADAARQKLRDLPAAQARPHLPFQLSEDTWNRLEASEAFQRTPEPRAMEVQVDLRTNSQEGKVESWAKEVRRLRQPAPGWLEVRSNTSSQQKFNGLMGSTGSVQSVQEYAYWAFGGLLQIGRLQGSTVASYIASIDRIEGSLFPMREGARIRVEGKYNNGAVLKLSKQVVGKVAASSLSPELTGDAWQVKPAEGDVPRNEGKYTVTEDYFLEDLGVFLSQVAVRTVPEKPLLMSPPGGQYFWDMPYGKEIVRTNYIIDRHVLAASK